MSKSIKNEVLEKLCTDLYQQGYSLCKQSAPAQLCQALLVRLQTLQKQQLFNDAKVGRNQNILGDKSIRSDKIFWMEGKQEQESEYFKWLDSIRLALNEQFYLGLNAFESHFSIYQPGDFYERHVDAFKGQSNRKVSLVLYLNDDWQACDGGEIQLYPPNQSALTLMPQMASFVIFMSEEIPHEVLIANKERYSIATWFRIDQ